MNYDAFFTKQRRGNNAAYLPEDSKLEYVAADKTVYLTFASRMGMKLVIR